MTAAEAEEKYEWLKLAVETVRESMDHLSQFPEKIEILFGQYPETLEDDAAEFIKEAHMPELHAALKEKISAADGFAPEDIKALLKEIQKEKGIKGKNLFMGSRVLLTGSMHGPDINNVLSLIGKENLLARLDQAEKKL